MSELHCCEDCIHRENTSTVYPCSVCTHNYTDKYEPRITNADKFREVFGDGLAGTLFVCSNCNGDISMLGKTKDWWNKEYKAPESVEE